MKNDVHLLYETSDSEQFSSKEDADKHELAWAVMCVISNFSLDCETQSQLRSDLLNEFDIHFKGEIAKVSNTEPDNVIITSTQDLDRSWKAAFERMNTRYRDALVQTNLLTRRAELAESKLQISENMNNSLVAEISTLRSRLADKEKVIQSLAAGNDND